jgi:hypothetical protein
MSDDVEKLKALEEAVAASAESRSLARKAIKDHEDGHSEGRAATQE